MPAKKVTRSSAGGVEALALTDSSEARARKLPAGRRTVEALAPQESYPLAEGTAEASTLQATPSPPNPPLEGEG